MSARSESRVFLSDRTERVWAYYDGDQGAGAAEAEAWAILTVTEPRISRLGVSTPTEQFALPYLRGAILGAEVSAALSEALFAFVGEGA